MNKLFVRLTILASTVLIVFGACRKRDAILPDNLVVFESTGQNFAAADNGVDIKLKLSRGTDRDIAVTINFTAIGLNYGSDFTTNPAAVSNAITVTVPSGSQETSFRVTKSPGALFDGDEKLQFRIYSSATPVLIGATKDFTLNFGEQVANSASATINGGGVNFPNKVFIDLSANRQNAVLRTSWDLGFYMGTDDYRVILNSASAMMAKSINKNDLTQVTAADTLGFATEVAFSQFAPTTTSLPYIDYPNGDLSRTAIAQVAANDADNKVYIVNRGTGVGNPAPARGWKKIRVLRNASGYTLQYADINATSFSTLTIAKDNNYFFRYISFETGTVEVEPLKNKWDIAWSYFSNVTNFGTGEVPYLFQDIIIQNRNVQVARVLTSTKAYADFDSTHLAGQSFSSIQTTIGSDWRSGGGPTSAPAVRTDRYYIVRDGDNNYYKVRFTSLTQAGERGYPSFEAALVKKGI